MRVFAKTLQNGEPLSALLFEDIPYQNPNFVITTQGTPAGNALPILAKDPGGIMRSAGCPATYRMA
jgi:hypothetical protein